MRLPLIPLLLLGCLAMRVPANEVAAEASIGDGSAPSPSGWDELLDSPRFRDRAEATRKLFLFGTKAVELLEQTVLTGGPEASGRAIEILQSHHQSQDHELKEAATAALQHIAASQDHPHSRRADRILNPVPQDDRLTARALRLPLLQLMQRAPAAAPPAPKIPAPPLPAPRIPAPARGIAPQQIRVEIKIVNGRRNMTIRDQGKTIRVADQDGKLEVEKDDGQGTITKATYKDRQELKAKDEETDRFLQKHGWPAEAP